VVDELIERRKDVKPEDKLGWYYRYWSSMNLARGTTPTFVFDDWNESIGNDPLFNKKLKTKFVSEVKNVSVLNDGSFDMDFGTFLNDECQEQESK